MSNITGDLDCYLHVEGFDDLVKELDFDKAVVRRGMLRAGRVISRRAQELVNQTTPSKPGQYPAKKTGLLQKSIKAKVKRSGFLVIAAPYRLPEQKDYYPAFLMYGVKNKANAAKTWRIAPRHNFMQQALADKAAEVSQIVSHALNQACKIK